MLRRTQCAAGKPKSALLPSEAQPASPSVVKLSRVDAAVGVLECAVAVPLAIDEGSVVLAGGPAAAVKVPADSAAVLFAILDAANISARESEER